MHWTDEVLQALGDPPPNANGVHVINDSKTPSGRAHVGALRGVLIHDAAFRVLRDRGVSVVYRFGCDDYDPVDELPHGMKEQYQQYLGQPLCNTPAPPGSTATDMADHFIKDFWSVFSDLGVRCEFYRMRDVYRSGSFNEPIERILRSASVVRAIYKDVSNAERSESWLPFQVICERCGRIGTTECSDFDGKTVAYVCRPDLVTWARGCGHSGRLSPFDGGGKLPWKLEWVAKWSTFPVTIEGAGEDHNTKGGSRDVAAQCLKAIYGREAPLNIPYSFVLVGGAKMSSSKGLGVSAREVADFLPPEALRFLMLRTKPRSQTNFEPTQEALVKLFNDLDRAHKKTFDDPKFPEHEKRTYFLSEVAPEGAFFDCEFSLVVALVQMPHLDIVAQFEAIKGSALTPGERSHLDRRVHAARTWLERYATEEERLVIQPSLPARAAELTPVQAGFLHELASVLDRAEWKGEALQAAVFDAARLTPIDQPSAFAAFYRVLLDKTAGPKAGNLLAFLEREWVVKRLREVALDETAFLRAAVSSEQQIVEWLGSSKTGAASADWQERSIGGVTVVELTVRTSDDKTHRRRIVVDGSAEAERFAGKIGAAVSIPIRRASRP
ncbi:MAG: lysine--tRNA ligase [Phycisphaeraceae bacterium]|nr:lysine--tRNA ligase [Phycisphaeraceae bacterium]